MTDPLDRADLATPERTLIDVIRATADLHPDASALEDEDGALSYRELIRLIGDTAERLHGHGVRRGDRVGIRMPSGSRELYIAILGTLAAGAAYVPVDADDPQERADLVFGEARVKGIIGAGGAFTPDPAESAPTSATQAIRIPDAAVRDADADEGDADEPERPASWSAHRFELPKLDDDAWIIFTSGSTGVPKGVAVTHRSAAAFVDAEARLFLPDQPLGPGDRVLAGLSVAFDASCEEMWLAWRHGACLVPAPRALVRSGEDLGPWLVGHGITAVSTVPTLAALWPEDAIENLRLLIFGGEALPPELSARLVGEGREVWNTYGPTEATVVASAARMDGTTPIRIGLPLDGWVLAVVDGEGRRVAEGQTGELVIGGVGLARYLDPVKDAEKYAPMPGLGWDRAYRSGDLVRAGPEGLVFMGRADDQVKVGGRRIELGEVETALQNLAAVSAAAVTVQKSEGGVSLLVSYVVPAEGFDRSAARAELAESLPAPLIPLIALMDELPVRVSGKVDKKALPWPLETGETDPSLTGTAAWLAEQWAAVLGAAPEGEAADFFAMGGGSLAAAQLVSRIRSRAPEFTMGDVYDLPRLGKMAEQVESETDDDDAVPEPFSTASPTPRSMRWLQTILGVPLFILSGARWVLWLLTAAWILQHLPGFEFLPSAPGWVILIGLAVFATPFGRMAITAIAARLLLAGVRPGDYRRGGGVHLRLWLAEQISGQIDAVGLAGAPWVVPYARALGAKIGRDVDLHTLPPVTGMLEVGDGASIEPEVDLTGYWIDGDTVRVGGIRIGAGATIGARSTLAPGTKVGRGAEVAPGSSVFGGVKAEQRWAGSPAARVSGRSEPLAKEDAPAGTAWIPAFALSSVVLGLLPVLAFVAGAAVIAWAVRGSDSLVAAIGPMLIWLLPATLVTGLVFAGLVVILVRLLSIGLAPGVYPSRSRVAWQAWTTERLLDSSRTILFPIYSSMFTASWLRMLGAKVGRNVEASTVLLLPALSRIDDGAFLADDTMLATYELRGGWMRLADARIGKRAFLGNSGMASAGRKVPKDALVAVLGVAPDKAKARSSWLGSPAMRLRRVVNEADAERTFAPKASLRVARFFWELCRMVPVFCTVGLGLAVIVALGLIADAWGIGAAVLLSGVVLLAAGLVAAAISTIAKWTFVGRISAGEHPLWSSFVWRTEVSDTFTEMLAAPWFANAAAGTPALAFWLRTLGARIGRGVWTDSYWLPEPDLVTLGDGAVVNRGCVVQTHLFHDRVMSTDTATLEAGATLGPHSVILPAASIGHDATVGPASLVMRGESVPAGSRWSGNPIGPWRAVKVREYQGRTVGR